VKTWAGDDPLLAYADRLAALEAAGGGALHVQDGGFVAGRPERAVLFVTTVHSAFDASHQKPLLDFVAASFAALDREYGDALALEASGAHRFAVASEQRAQGDAAWISAVSLVALVVCFLAIYRSLAVLILTFLPLGFGMLAAAAATLALFGGLHALTLAFGAALIGICTDYPLHLVSHWALRAPGDGEAQVLARIRTPLLMAAGTTCAGFWALGASELPGIREVAVFAAIGVAAAAFATLVAIPALLAPSIVATRAPAPTARAAAARGARPTRARRRDRRNGRDGRARRRRAAARPLERRRLRV
jgi:predicted exporter